MQMELWWMQNLKIIPVDVSPSNNFAKWYLIQYHLLQIVSNQDVIK